MKKLLALMMGLLLTMLLTVSAFAIPVKSPSQGGVPDVTIVSNGFVDANGDPVGGGCVPVLKKTPYQDKDKVGIAGTVIQQSLETAYNSYKNGFGTDARAMLNAANSTGNWYTKYPGWDLRVVNIFDITLLCGDDNHNNGQYGTLPAFHPGHQVSMKLEDEDASNFVALMHYKTGDAQWELISTTQQDNKIFFEVKCSNLSPFAIVVKSRTGGGGSETGEPTSPQTGEVSNIGYWLSCGTFLAAVGVTTLYRMKKEKRYAR